MKTGKNWSNVPTDKGIPKISGNQEKLRRGMKGFFPRVFRENMVRLTPHFHLISKVQNYERINLCCLSHSIYGIMFWQPQLTKTECLTALNWDITPFLPLDSS